MSTTIQFLSLIILLLFPSLISAHGFMEYPPQRGCLNPKSKHAKLGSEYSAPIDWLMHFPAGNKADIPGAAVQSQRETSGIWTPFEPMKSDFIWRAGVCGDLKSKTQDHMKGGRYYYDGKVSAEYIEGSIIDITIKVIAHHNGFMELHVCDIAKCGGEISEDCFKQGHCWQLKRAPNKDCDSAYDKRCAPIDKNYPGRWYLPCTTKPINGNAVERMGGNKMQYYLPKGLVCEHCVLHWFWEAANTCNAPGIREYYDGPNSPKNWGQCPGQGAARGGIAREQRDCGPNRFPEEYYTCADIRIKPSDGSSTTSSFVVEEEDTTQTSITETIKTPEPIPIAVTDTSGDWKIQIYGDGKLVDDNIEDGEEVDMKNYDKVALEAVKSDGKGPVDFLINGNKVWTDWTAPFFMYGNRGRDALYGDGPPLNEEFTLEVIAGDEMLKRRITIWK